MINRVTTTSGDIEAGKYRYKIAFAKSGANKKYRNTGAEGNIFSNNKFDSYLEVDTTESYGTRGIKLQFNKELLEGKTLMHCSADPEDSGDVDGHYINV